MRRIWIARVEAIHLNMSPWVIRLVGIDFLDSKLTEILHNEFGFPVFIFENQEIQTWKSLSHEVSYARGTTSDVSWASAILRTRVRSFISENKLGQEVVSKLGRKNLVPCYTPVMFSRAKTGFQSQHCMVRIQHVRFFFFWPREKWNGWRSIIECLGTFHKLKLLQMKFVIGKKRGASRFWGDVKS